MRAPLSEFTHNAVQHILSREVKSKGQSMSFGDALLTLFRHKGTWRSCFAEKNHAQRPSVKSVQALIAELSCFAMPKNQKPFLQ